MFVYVYNQRRQPYPYYSQSWKRLWEPRGGAGQVLLSESKIKDSIMEELELELGFKSDKDLQKGSKAIPG